MTSVGSSLELKTTHLLCIALLITLVVRSLIRRWKHRKVYTFMSSIPGPIAFPLLGTSYMMIGTTVQNLCIRLRYIIDNYPGYCGFWYFEDPVLITDDREVFNAILGSYQNVDKFRHYKHFATFISGLFTSNGAEWRKTRKIVNPSFRSNILASFNDNFSYHTETFLQRLGRYANGKEFDIYTPVHLCTLDFIFDNMMNTRVEVQKKNLEFLSNNLIRGSEMLFERTFNPLIWSDFIYSIVGKKEIADKDFYEGYNFLQEMMEHQIKTRSELKKKNPAVEPLQTVMEVLIKSIESGIVTKERAMADLFEMYLAGSLTTAITNAWVFKLLAHFPEFQEKAYQEVVEIFAGEPVSLDNVSKLVYLEMIIKETLRHYTIPLTGRRISHDLEVNEKVTIPAGMEVVMSVFALHHDAKHWQRPYEFWPEHFSPANESNRLKGTFVPFLSGPRACPGYKYAMQSIKFLVANTLLHYKFSTDEKLPADMRDLDYLLKFMIWPADGFKIKCERRRCEDSLKTNSSLASDLTN